MSTGNGADRVGGRTGVGQSVGKSVRMGRKTEGRGGVDTDGQNHHDASDNLGQLSNHLHTATTMTVAYHYHYFQCGGGTT